MSSDSQLSITDTVFLETRFQILSGAYLPGSNLDRDQICDVYGCSPRLVLDVFNALKAEGYLDVPGRGLFAVRLWDSNQLEDYYDLWSNIVGVSAARAAERAQADDLVALASLFNSTTAFDPSDGESVEHYLSEYVRFTGALIQISKAAPLMTLSNAAVPNFLFRRAIWSSTAEELLADRKSLDVVLSKLAARSGTFAKDALREVIMRTLPAAKRDMAEAVSVETNAPIARPSLPLKRGGVMFDLGGREPGLDGKVVAFGTTGRV